MENNHMYDAATCPEVAVIILNWNGRELMRRYLPSVVDRTPAEAGRVIVADNGSTDGSLQMLAEEFPQVEVISFDRNYGFADGYNRAIELTQYPFTVLLNSDVEVTAGWLEPLAATMRDNERMGACQPKLLSDVNREYFEYAGAMGGFIDRNGYPYCRGRIFDVCEKDSGQYDRRVTLMWATGACLMVRTQVYRDCGGLDAAFFAHMEEIDLCWHMRLAGWNIVAVPASVVYHYGGGSLPADNPRKTYLNFRNNLLMLHKNLPKADLRATLLRRRLLDTVAWAKFVATGKFSYAAAIVRAHRDFRKMRRAYTSHPSSNLLKGHPEGRLNILVQYYLRGRKHFSDLN